MSDGLAIKPEFTVTLARRTASSACCAAKLNPGAEPETFTCRACGHPCERILSAPEEVTAHG